MANGINKNLCFPRVYPTAMGCNSGEPQMEQWEVRAVGRYSDNGASEVGILVYFGTIRKTF